MSLPSSKTRPSASRVADTAPAFFRSSPIWLKVPVAGSYTSTELIDCELSEVSPPAMSTRPFFSNVAVWFWRPLIIDPVALNFPVAGSYSYAELGMLALAPVMLDPPATSTRPSGRSVAVSPSRGVDIDPVELNFPVVGS